MKVISAPGVIKFSKTAVAIGIFDGVHRGHQFLIKQMVSEARKLKAKAVVVTFFPHPAHILRPDIALLYLMPPQQRFEVFKKLGVDAVVVIRFNKKFAQVNPEVFIENFLCKKLKAQSIFVGEDFRFGKDRSGDVALFKNLSTKLNYRMHAVKPLKQGAEVISSSRLRRLIPEGKLKEAQRLLGRPVSVTGKVIAGASRGKSLGYPTANVDCDGAVLPPRGVYAVRVMIGKNSYDGMANLGLRPSFKGGDSKLHLEVHLFNFKRMIYGQDITVEFIKKTRDEKKFSSKEDLIAQIQKDESIIRRLFKVE